MKLASQPRRVYLRVAIILGIIALLGLFFGLVDLRPNYSHLDTRILSGSKSGNYYAIVKKLQEASAERQGRIVNQETNGTADNLERLVKAASSCEAEFALVQDGVPPPPQGRDKLELIGRLPRSESLFLLGRDASSLTHFAQIKGFRIGVGPTKSGTDIMARQLFEAREFRRLSLKLSNHSLDEQVHLLESGDLDLGAFVINEDAAFIRDVVLNHGLELAAFENLDVIARHYPFLGHGRIGAGHFDPVELVPPEDRQVLRVNTLLVGNRCAGHSENVILLTILSKELPGFMEQNRSRGSSSLFRTSSTSEAFFANNGPQLVEEHLPWLVDIMPPSNWVYIVMAISMLFNAMALGHRFRLWRVDATRLKIEGRLFDTLGNDLTIKEIAKIEPREDHVDPKVLKTLTKILGDLGAHRIRCRKYSVSMLVPMGQEMAYRYQESQIEVTIAAVRQFRQRLKERLSNERAE